MGRRFAAALVFSICLLIVACGQTYRSQLGRSTDLTLVHGKTCEGTIGKYPGRQIRVAFTFKEDGAGTTIVYRGGVVGSNGITAETPFENLTLLDPNVPWDTKSSIDGSITFKPRNSPTWWFVFFDPKLSTLWGRQHNPRTGWVPFELPCS